LRLLLETANMRSNPALRKPMGGEKTRFKVWWRLCGSAVENAAFQHAEYDATHHDGVHPTAPAKVIDFKDLFLSQEEDDEESASLADALAGMAWKWPNGAMATANEIAKVINDQSEVALESDKQLSVTLREFLFPSLPLGHTASSKATGKRLKSHVGEPVKRGNQTLILRAERPGAPIGQSGWSPLGVVSVSGSARMTLASTSRPPEPSNERGTSRSIQILFVVRYSMPSRNCGISVLPSVNSCSFLIIFSTTSK
jgi:hypothetical protein